MKIQSLSVVVPNKKCINNCDFCVSKMHNEDYRNLMDENMPFYDLYEKDYIRRLEFARDNGCNTIMLTGNSEPQQNRSFLMRFGSINKNLPMPFRWIEMQTTGVMLDENYLRFLRNHVGVSTISVSISAFDDQLNQSYINAHDKLYVPLVKLCELIRKYDFNLRLSINLTDGFNAMSAASIFEQVKHTYGANQVTFRVLYTSEENDTPQDLWIQAHRVNPQLVTEINEYIKKNGRPLERLEFGAMKYSVDEMSVVLDDDCMSSEVKDVMKYLILRENCKLYSKWDDKGSLIF